MTQFKYHCDFECMAEKLMNQHFCKNKPKEEIKNE